VNKDSIKDEKGKVIGYRIAEKDGNATYLTPGGKVVARVRNETTLGQGSSVKGRGDQGLRFFPKT
jgi:hypothetical protein